MKWKHSELSYNTLNLGLCDEYCYSDAKTFLAIASAESAAYLSTHLDVEKCILSKELFKRVFLVGFSLPPFKIVQGLV